MVATSEVGIHHIQKQIDNCDSIVNNIDIIVPKLYKIRQQALSQKEYINDIQGVLLNTGSSSISSSNTGKIATLDNALLTNLVSTTYVTTAFNTSNSANQRSVFQSLFKYKHDVGTSAHFTTDQIGSSTDRTDGLNLIDVVDITTSLNLLLTASNTASSVNGLDKLILKPGVQSSIVPIDTDTASIVVTSGGPISSSYASDPTNGLASHLTNAITVSNNIVGFGLT